MNDKCDCDCGEPTSFTIRIGDDPPIFVVNLGLLEAIAERWRAGPVRLKVGFTFVWNGDCCA